MQDASDSEKITPNQLKQWLDEGRDLNVIDTLPREVYEQRRIAGAKNACVYEVFFPDKVDEILQLASMR